MTDDRSLLAQASTAREKKGNLNAALESVNTVLEHNPRSNEAQLFKAAILIEHGELSAASELLQINKQQLSDTKTSVLIDCLNLQATVAFRQGNMNNAYQYAEQACVISETVDAPESTVRALELFSHALYRQHEYALAADTLSQALELAETIRFVPRHITLQLEYAARAYETGSSDSHATYAALIDRVAEHWHTAYFFVLTRWFEVLCKSENSFTNEQLDDLSQGYTVAKQQGWVSAQAQLAVLLSHIATATEQTDAVAEYTGVAERLFTKMQISTTVRQGTNLLYI